MRILLDDSLCRRALFPFTHTRHAAHIRIGILTLQEKWEKLGGLQVYVNPAEAPADAIHISANIIPTLANYEAILKNNQAEEVRTLTHPWQIFQWNDWAIKEDFLILTKGRQSAAISTTNHIINPGQVFLEPGATVEYSIINAESGPVYIGAHARVMEGCLIRGSFSLGENAVLKMGTKIYGATTLGPGCVGGGEIKNSVMFSHSNKAHEGYLGDSVIGSWCNLGAGTSNSNVKNTGAAVKYKIDAGADFEWAGNKAGLLMGDYSRCAINTSFNTGTVVGVCCNIFSAGMPAVYIPNFTWDNQPYIFEKAIADICNWKQMKGAAMSELELQQLKHLYESK